MGNQGMGNQGMNNQGMNDQGMSNACRRANQLGGQTVAAPSIVKQRPVLGTPFVPNTAKEIYKKDKAEDAETQPQTQPPKQLPLTIPGPKPSFPSKPPVPPGPITRSQSIPNRSTLEPTFRLEMFAPDQKPPVPSAIYPMYNPTLNQFVGLPPGMGPYGPITYAPNVRMPMQQVFNIVTPGPTGGHIEMNKIIENTLPGKEYKMTATTLGERLQTYDYVRQILIKSSDGEDISLNGTDHHSLMSYIKIMELNPNYYSPISNNPYKGLAVGLLVYRSCFPIRFDQRGQSIICARNSIGLNIRLYALSYAEYYMNLMNQILYKEYDVWRELAYYEYMREQVLKKKQSPNFPLLYAYFLSPNRQIDFFALKKQCLTQKDMLTREYEEAILTHKLFATVTPSIETFRPMTLPDAARKVISKLPDEIDPALQRYSGTTLVLVTEAPHHNLYQWASRGYEPYGIVQHMVKDGWHTADTWFGVLFQIVSALYVMQIHGIYMRDMTIEDNIFIKDLQIGDRSQGYWKYVIDGVAYYVPNYGYLVLVDSNFKDIKPEGRTTEHCKREYKIYTSNIIGKRYNLEAVRRKVFENYRRIINTNAFTKEHTQNEVFRPPESIMDLIGKMMTDPETDLSKVLAKYFAPLMNNRVGTLLRKDTEVPNVRDITGQPKRGELVVEVIGVDLYKWALVISNKSGGMVEIVSRENADASDFSTREVRLDSLKQFSPTEKVEQNSNPDVNLSEDGLLETYIISKD